MTEMDKRAIQLLQETFADSNWRVEGQKWISGGGVTVQFAGDRVNVNLAPAQLVMLLNSSGIAPTELDEALDAAAKELHLPEQLADALRLEVKVQLAKDEALSTSSLTSSVRQTH